MIGTSRQKHRIRRLQTPQEERFNALSHAVLATVLVTVLPAVLLSISRSARGDTRIRALSVLVYMICILTMLISSSLYHALPADSRHKRTLNRIDHISIYLAIAGSYTPIALATLGRATAIRVLLAEWGLAAAGVLFKLTRFRTGRANAIASTLLYLGMGWMIVLYGPQFRQNASPGLTGLVLAGGIAYTVGVFFNSIQKPLMHNIWHVCVAAGVLCHFLGVVHFL